jgi:chromate transporter
MGGGRAREVFAVFLRLGLTCFGGPMVHFVMFRQEFVERRAWVSERQFGHLLTLSQFLPGPGSSKLGFAIGLLRGGWTGALAAFFAFTLPSALLLFAFAALLPRLAGGTGQAIVHGLKLVALAVVTQGLVGMWRTLCPDLPRRALAVLAAALVLRIGANWAQLLAVGLGAAIGSFACRNVHPDFSGQLEVRHGARAGALLLTIFALLLVGLPLAARFGQRDALRYAQAFFETGAMAFGGGHVVLPLLQAAVVEPGWIPQADFLAGYGAAQAVPGPMFALSAYLGARLPGPDGGVLGAGIALVATFLPGFLLIAGVLPFWRDLAGHPRAARAIAGVSATVVGLLAAALYDPVWVSAVHAPADVAIAALALGVMTRWRVSVLWIVALCVLASVALALLVPGAHPA